MIKVIDTGLKRYAEVLKLQEELFTQNVEAKIAGTETTNYLILCEHEHVFTLGKVGKRENIKVNEGDLSVDIFQTNRGGDVTYHGPGQMVAYPIIDMDKFRLGVHQYVTSLEEVIINTVTAYGVKGERLEGAPGIWVHAGTDHPEKICAIGIKGSRSITMHGLALNVNTDLSWFDKIIPCGIEGKKATSIQKELNRPIDMEEFKKVFTDKFNEVFKEVAPAETNSAASEGVK